MKIGLIHTTMNSIGPSNSAFQTLGKEIECINFLNEGVMPELRSKGATPRVRREILQMAWNAEAAGAQGIMLNCSLMSPYAEELQTYVDVPLISADLAMLAYVVKKASSVGVIATVPAAGPTTKRLLLELASQKGKNLRVEVAVIPAAFTALNDGDEAKHNKLIQEASRAFDGNVDKIVFAQISMVRALQEGFKTQTEIVTSPAISARTLIQKILSSK